ncbi:MAG: protein kinase [Acidimicrobiales bacterium]|nr:protein kinase [Acidimicrobiales bacterium]
MSGAKGPPPDLPGFTFSAAIGGGGFADVFLYTQHSTGRAVAVKVLRSEHLSERSLDQFQIEANVMAGVSAHPYIVTIHDAGVAPDGRPYLVMEHYSQPHFGIRSRGGRLAVAEVLKVGVQVAAAVETAHRSQIIHRDIKPANILTSAYGNPGLTDFGIAGVQAGGELTAATGLSLGYAAREVVLDEAATGSAASDVYSLVATIYALLVGRSPVYVAGGDNSPEALTQRIAAGRTQPLGRDDVPSSLEHLLRSGLSGEPSHRPRSAAAVGQALQDVEHELQLPATPLVLDHDLGSAVGRAPLGDDGEDGTRRRPKVVDAEGERTTARSGTAAPPITGPPPAPSPGPRPRDDAGLDGSDTVARPGATEPEPVSVSTEAPRRSRPARWRLGVAAGAAAVVLVVVLFALGGGDEDGGSAATTSAPAVAQDPVGQVSFVGVPRDVTLDQADDGSLSVSWQPPEGIRGSDEVTYRVESTAEGAVDWIDDLADTSAPLTGIEPDEDGWVCVVVRAIVDPVISDPSDEVCAEAPEP